MTKSFKKKPWPQHGWVSETYYSTWHKACGKHPHSGHLKGPQCPGQLLLLLWPSCNKKKRIRSETSSHPHQFNRQQEDKTRWSMAWSSQFVSFTYTRTFFIYDLVTQDFKLKPTTYLVTAKSQFHNVPKPRPILLRAFFSSTRRIANSCQPKSLLKREA